MNSWKVIKSRKAFPKLKEPVLIEGLPGIGNVGKVAADFIIEQIGAVKLCDFFSYTLPHSVFVNEDNLVELPTISLYYKKGKKKDVLILAGDVQPVDEISSYEFSEKILDVMQDFGSKEVVTLGGIGLPGVPKKPKLYCTGNDSKIVAKYNKDMGAETNIYGVVGPIIGVSGLLLGLAKKRNIPAVTFLAETYGHPMYLGIKGARELVKVLNIKLDLGINLKDLDKEIKEMENEANKKAITHDMPKQMRGLNQDVNYIG